MEHIRVAIVALDPITVAGLKNCIEQRAGLILTRDEADVAVAMVHRLDPDAIALLNATATQPIVLIIDQIGEAELPVAARCGVVALLPRSAAADDRLVRAIQDAAAQPGGPPNPLGRLRSQAARLDRPEPGPIGLSERETEVLRGLANGLGTREIARDLGYSERTVKSIIYLVTNRLNLRNRTHAVAYAIRSGAI